MPMSHRDIYNHNDTHTHTYHLLLWIFLHYKKKDKNLTKQTFNKIATHQIYNQSLFSSITTTAKKSLFVRGEEEEKKRVMVYTNYIYNIVFFILLNVFIIYLSMSLQCHIT